MIFPGQGKVRELFGWPGKLRRDLKSRGKVREKSGNMKNNSESRQSLENVFVLFNRGKDVLSHEIV